jgi:hypothetical protein
VEHVSDHTVAVNRIGRNQWHTGCHHLPILTLASEDELKIGGFCGFARSIIVNIADLITSLTISIKNVRTRGLEEASLEGAGVLRADIWFRRFEDTHPQIWASTKVPRCE